MFKPISLDARRDYISLDDPAIDHSAMSADDLKRYYQEWLTGGDWRGALKLFPGEQPTVFSVGALGPEELNGILDDTRGTPPRAQDRNWRLFLAGLRDITNWQGKIDREDGRPDKEWLRKTFVGALRKVALDVGAAVLQFNSITEGDVKNLSGRSKLRSDTAAPPAPSAPISSESAADASAPAAK